MNFPGKGPRRHVSDPLLRPALYHLMSYSIETVGTKVLGPLRQIWYSYAKGLARSVSAQGSKSARSSQPVEEAGTSPHTSPGPGGLREAVVATLRRSGQDGNFSQLVAVADGHREAGRFGEAFEAYMALLALEPLHCGYRVQAGHMLKDQGRFSDAELLYRDALALGAAPSGVIEHLVFAAHRAACPGLIYRDDVLAAFDADRVEDGVGSAAFALELVTAGETADILALAFDAHDLSPAACLAVMRRAPQRDEMLAAMIASQRFTTENPRLAAAATGALR